MRVQVVKKTLADQLLMSPFMLACEHWFGEAQSGV